MAKNAECYCDNCGKKVTITHGSQLTAYLQKARSIHFMCNGCGRKLFLDEGHYPRRLVSEYIENNNLGY